MVVCVWKSIPLPAHVQLCGFVVHCHYPCLYTFHSVTRIIQVLPSPQYLYAPLSQHNCNKLLFKINLFPAVYASAAISQLLFDYLKFLRRMKELQITDALPTTHPPTNTQREQYFITIINNLKGLAFHQDPSITDGLPSGTAVTTDPGSIAGYITTGHDQESHRVAHNFLFLGKQILIYNDALPWPNQLCAALWDSRPWPIVLQPRIGPASSGLGFRLGRPSFTFC